MNESVSPHSSKKTGDPSSDRLPSWKIETSGHGTASGLAAGAFALRLFFLRALDRFVNFHFHSLKIIFPANPFLNLVILSAHLDGLLLMFAFGKIITVKCITSFVFFNPRILLFQAFSRVFLFFLLLSI